MAQSQTGTSRWPGELEDVDAGAGAPSIKHDAIEDLVPVRSRAWGAEGLLGPPRPRSSPSNGEEGLGSRGPVPLDIGNIDEQAHAQAEGICHLRHPQGPMVWYFSHFSVCWLKGEESGK